MPGDDMSRKIFVLFAPTTGLIISLHASENVNTPEPPVPEAAGNTESAVTKAGHTAAGMGRTAGQGESPSAFR